MNARRPTITIVSEYFWPEEAGSGRFLGELAAGLVREFPGLEARVITSTRVYRSSTDGQMPGRQRVNGWAIRRMRSIRRGNDGFLRRLTADALFSLGAALRLLAGPRPDALIAGTNPPLAPLLLAPIAGALGIPYAYVVHDLYPDVPVALGIWGEDGLVSRILHRLQRRTLHGACRVIVLGRCMEERLQEAYELPPERCAIIPHWATIEPLDQRERAEIERRKQPEFTVLYAGNFGRFQDFDTILRAAELLREQPAVRFDLIGRGAERDRISREVERRGLANVRTRDFVGPDAFREHLLDADIGLVTLEPGLEGLGVPSKTYNLLAAGLPVAAIMGAGAEVARTIEECGCGARIDHGDADALAEFIDGLRRDRTAHRDMRRRALERADEMPGPATAAQRMARVVRDCLRQGAA